MEKEVTKSIYDWIDDDKYRCYFNGEHIQKENSNGSFSDFTRLDKAQTWLQGYVDVFKEVNPDVDVEFYVQPPKSKGKKKNMSYLMQIQNGDISTIPPVISVLYPVLYNFRVDDTDPTKVLFDSTSPLIGTTTTGFIVTGKTISGLTINSGQLTGHSFTVSSAFSYWSNNTIRYEGGSNVKDSTDTFPIVNFTLAYIQNNIPEPVGLSAGYRYVSATAVGGQNGQSEANPWTLAEVRSQVASGQTVFVKAGDYGTDYLDISASGTPTSPIKIIGYKTAITGGESDITSNYFDYGVTMDSAEMPMFTAGRSDDAVVITGDNVIVKNIQVYDSEAGFVINATNVIFENCNAEEIYSTSGGGYGFVYFGSNSGSNHRFLNNRVINAAFNFWVEGDYSLMKDCKSYGDVASGNGFVNYYYSTGGDYSIYLNNYTKAVGDVDGGEHGFSMQNLNSSTHEYCLNEGQVVINMNKALEVRHDGVNFNVIRGLHIYGEGAGSSNTGGVRFRNEADNNTLENSKIESEGGAYIAFEEASESGTGLGTGNMVINCVFTGGDWVFFASNDNTGVASGDIKVYNCSFDTTPTFIYGGSGGGSGTTSIDIDFRNNIIDGLTSDNAGEAVAGSRTFQNNNLYNCGAWTDTYIGSNGNIEVDALLDSNLEPTGSTPTSITEGGQTLTLVGYDYENEVRTVPYSMGAFQEGSGGTPPTNPEIYTEGDAGDSVNPTATVSSNWDDRSTATITADLDGSDHYIKAVADVTDNAYVEIAFPTINGDSYEVKMDVKAPSINTQSVIFFEATYTEYDLVNTTWTSITFTVTANTTSGNAFVGLMATDGTGVIGDEIHVKNISIKKV